MSIETVEAHLISHRPNHWDIISAWYELGNLCVTFKDGSKGAIPISQFPELANAIEQDFEDLQVSSCGLILENERIEWDYAEAGLYQLINGS